MVGDCSTAELLPHLWGRQELNLRIACKIRGVVVSENEYPNWENFEKPGGPNLISTDVVAHQPSVCEPHALQ